MIERHRIQRLAPQVDKGTRLALAVAALTLALGCGGGAAANGGSVGLGAGESKRLEPTEVGAGRGTGGRSEVEEVAVSVTPGPALAPSAEWPLVEILEVEVVRELPHRRGSYTQGLFLHEGLVYESRGQFGRSGIDVWEPVEGTIVRSVDLDGDLFGEGIERVEGFLWQLTWQSGLALRWSLDALEQIGEASYTGEGWGLAYDGRRLIMSDGTHELRFFDPNSFEYLGKSAVVRGNSPQDQLNELEYVADGNLLFANIYQTDEIVRIALDSGEVTGVATLQGLLTRGEARRAEVLNGIAYWPERDSFLITGKHWAKSFEVKFHDPK